LQNVERLLDAAGCRRRLGLLSDLDTFERYNRIYERFFPDPKPVRTTVGAQLLGGLLIEMTVTARRPGA
jgi:2-iminobutanoate/2-iminopropanoate deaminase